MSASYVSAAAAAKAAILRETTGLVAVCGRHGRPLPKFHLARGFNDMTGCRLPLNLTDETPWPREDTICQHCLTHWANRGVEFDLPDLVRRAQEVLR